MDPQQEIYDSMASNQSRHHHGLGSEAAPNPPSDAAAQARLIAARLAAQMAVGGISATSVPSVFSSFAPQESTDTSDPTDPLAKARAIAARLGLAAGGSMLGKRRTDGDGGFAWGKGETGKLQNKIVVPVHTGHNYSGMLLGPKGTTLKNIEAESGSRVYLRGRGTSKPDAQPTPEDEEDMHVIVMADTDEQLAKATAMIEDILFNPGRAEDFKRSGGMSSLPLGGGLAAFSGGSGYGPPGGGDGSSFTIPNPLVGFIIGKGGENIKELQARTGTHVNIQRETEMLPGATERVITVSGPPQGAADAKAAIQNMVRARQLETGGGGMGAGGMGGASAAAGGGGPSVQCPVPNEMVGSIIGRAGMTIKALQARTGTHIQIPREADVGNPKIRTITITSATAEGVQAAQAELMRLVQNQSDMNGGGAAGVGTPFAGYVPPEASVSLNVPNERVGAVIGRAGLVIKEIQQRTGTRVQMPREIDPAASFRMVTITGSTQAVESARSEIQAIIDTGHSPYPEQQAHMMAPNMQAPGYGAPSMGYGMGGPMGYGAGYPAMGMPQYGYGAAASPAAYYGAPQAAVAPAGQGASPHDAWAAYYAQQAAAAAGAAVAPVASASVSAPATETASVPAAPEGDSAAAPAAQVSTGTGSNPPPADAAAAAAAWQQYYAQQQAWAAYYGGAAPGGSFPQAPAGGGQ